MAGLKTVKIVGLCALATLLALAGCKRQGPQDTEQPGTGADTRLQVQEIATVTVVDDPESAVVVPGREQVLISSIEPGPEGGWVKNGKGFITLIDYEGNVVEERWLDSQEGAVLNGPKGLNILDGYLYIADIDRLLRVPIEGERTLEVVATEVDGQALERVNDIATDGELIWFSDTETGRVMAYDPSDGSFAEIKAPEGVNGLTFDGETMYGVSWPLTKVYELDPTGEKEPVEFGLDHEFESLDSIEVLEDGTFIVTDFRAETVYTIGADRATVTPLVEGLESCADVDVDEDAGLLFVPLMFADQLKIFEMSKTE